jgi:hypothetical protein
MNRTGVVIDGRELTGEELARIYAETQPESYADMLEHIGVTHTWEEYIAQAMALDYGGPDDEIFWRIAGPVARHIGETRRAETPAGGQFSVEPTDPSVLQEKLRGVTKDASVKTEYTLGGLPVVFNPTVRGSSILCVEGPDISVTGGLEVLCTAEAFAECQSNPELMRDVERMVRMTVDGLMRLRAREASVLN